MLTGRRYVVLHTVMPHKVGDPMELIPQFLDVDIVTRSSQLVYVSCSAASFPDLLGSWAPYRVVYTEYILW